ncbi:MAG TPA: MEDS domain-containing protein [Candidatus Sulfotelmatobacter sp.]
MEHETPSTSSTPCTIVRLPHTDPFGCDHRLYPHAVQFYLKEDFLLGILCDFIVSALKARDGVVIVATEEHRGAILQCLKVRGIDVDALKGNGSYVELDASETLLGFMVDGKPDFERFDRLIGGAIAAARDASGAKEPSVMVFGELVDLLGANRELEAALGVERFWKTLARRLSFSLLCGYSMKRFAEFGTEAAFLQICAEHATVSPPEAYATAESEERILRATAQIYGETSLAQTATQKIRPRI